MNSLSLFLYFVDVLISLSYLLHAVSMVGIAIFTAFVIGTAITCGDFLPHDRSILIKKIKPFAYALGIVMLLNVVIPSERTMYLILGSELGEEMITSETGQRVFDVVNKRLEEYILEGSPKE